MNDIAGIKAPMGPPPANLVRLQATRQNTIALDGTKVVLVRRPDTDGGPDVWTWYVLNIGPGNLWLRWDGLGYAGVADPNSISLPAGHAYSDIKAAALTFAADGALTASYTADNLES
jgi:hypothetical protein